MIELQFITLGTFVISLFVLYRVLIKKYEEHVNLLKDELSYKQNYREKLEEFKLFYQEELEILTKRLRNSESENSDLEDQIKLINIRIDEIKTELSRESDKKERVALIATRQQQYLHNNLRNLETQFEGLVEENEKIKKEYRELVKFIKERYGANALLDFHYGDNLYEQIKHRRQYNVMKKYE
ncbi:MAG: hypothetical protein AB1442_09985 [Nitrospirota bacterium]